MKKVRYFSGVHFLKYSLVLLFLIPCLVKAQAGKQGADPSLDSLKNAIEAHPDSLGYHEEFIKAFRQSKGATWQNQDSVMALLEPQYEQWIRQFPRSAIVPFAIGHAYANAESPKAKSYLLKAVKLDPKLAQAWMDLSFDADRWGDAKAAMEYMGKASAAEPDNPNYAFYYAFSFEDVDQAKWRSMLYDVVKRFPKSERGAQSLYWLAYRTKDTAEKRKVYEQLRKLYPPDQFRWSAGGMNGLFDVYLRSDPRKAQQLARDMGEEDGWPKLDTVARGFAKADALMSQHRYKEAAAAFRKIKLPRYTRLTDMLALSVAKADDAAGNTESAYDSLVALFAKEPTDELYAAVSRYGKKLQKDAGQIKEDVWKIRDKDTKPAPPFNLGLYTSGGKLSLQDLRGKVVLLTFWFPGCGPCRGEFPHFQHVINKFKEKDVAYVGINVVPQQDQYVLPFMEGTGYTFIPLRADGDWAEKVYKVRGEPTNFLIDQQGRIVFSHFRIDGGNERTLELMINSLLQRKG